MKLDRVIAVRNDKTIYRDAERCIKVFDESYSKSDVLNEAFNQARMEDLLLNIPKLIEVTQLDGKWAIASEYIKGKTFAQLMEEEPAKKSEYIERFVKLQIMVNEKTSPLFNKLKDKMSARICALDINASLRYKLYSRLEGIPKQNKICHGDFNPSNVIVSENGVPYIIDWSHVTQGDAAADAAESYLWFLMNGDESGAEEYLDMYCDYNRINREHVENWIPLVAASQLAKDTKGKREFLLSWVEKVNRV